ncbi:hypothetical protein TRAPUB_896 [Trametes pubescens]|uniref:F-box domain-containing protein n=1 Tax=Trametes pubescens TaxID=154538 RepID=A0A1M2VKT8_TRAPU|nr:hypothetical protein TRAPUB_896 [Trametes pubescens]
MAVAMLWERLDSIDPILPLWEGSNTKSSSAISVSTVPKRVAKYTRHVHAIALESGTIPPAWLTKLASPLFANLKRLRWDVPSNTVIQPFSSFVVPSVVAVRVHAAFDAIPSQDPDWDFLTALSNGVGAIARRCTALTDLELIWNGGPLLRTSIVDMLSPLLSLQTLRISTNLLASRQALFTLSKLPSLRSLEITHFEETLLYGMDLVPASAGFNALEAFSLDGPFPVVHDLLKSLPCCRVRQCILSMTGNTSQRHQRTAVDLLARRFGASLDALLLSFLGSACRPHIAHTTLSPLFLDTVLPTLRTLDLVDVSLAWLAPRSVSDALCADMAAAWPRLRAIRLGSAEAVMYPPLCMVTLRGLRHFAERCPHLEDVRLQVNAAGDHWAAEARSACVSVERAARAVKLDLATSLVTHPEGVAAYLRACFRTVSELRFGRNNVQPYVLDGRVAAWDKLCSLLLSDRAAL